VIQILIDCNIVAKIILSQYKGEYGILGVGMERMRCDVAISLARYFKSVDGDFDIKEFMKMCGVQYT